MAGYEHAAANNLALLHRQIDGIAALITDDQIELSFEGFLEDFCQQVSAVGGAGGAAFRRLA